MADLKDADLVVEAVVESLEVKKAIFRALDDIVARRRDPGHQHLVAVGHRDLAPPTRRPGRVVGVHFFNPAPVQNLVEIIRTVVTEPDVLEDVAALVAPLGKNPGRLRRQGRLHRQHAAVRLPQPRGRRCSRASYATREDIDAAMRFGCGYPMGPLALLDLIGLDTAYEILDTMYKQGRDRLHAPAPILKQMVTAGLLGRKTGRGFYTYEAPDSPVVVADDQTPSADDKPQLRHDIRTRRRRRHRHDGHRHRRGLRQGRLRRRCTSAARPDKVDGVRATIERSLDKAIQRGKLEESARDEVLGRLTGTTSLDDLADVDLVVEAIAEDLKIKTTLFENLDEICKPGAILATTTSSLPIISLAQATNAPAGRRRHALLQPGAGDEAGRGGLHRDRPTTTSPRPPARCARRSARSPVSCGDRAGFIVNALLFPYLNDAVKMLEAHYATADDIDTAMKQGCALPMGPFELLDVVGNDVSLAIQRELYLEFREPGFAPAPLLEHLVTAGYLGRKTKRGFRDYSAR